MKKLVALMWIAVLMISSILSGYDPPQRLYRDPCTGWNDYYDYGMGYADILPGPSPTQDYLLRAANNGEPIFDRRVDMVDGSSVMDASTGASTMGIDPLADQFLPGAMSYRMRKEYYTYAEQYNNFFEYPGNFEYPGGILQAVAWGAFSADLELEIEQDLGDHTNTVVIRQPSMTLLFLQEYQIVDSVLE